MAEHDRIVAVRTATIVHALRVPIRFGTWVISDREFILVRVDAESGLSGFAYGLTRDGPVDAVIRRTVTPNYVGAIVSEPADLFYRTLESNHATHAAGVGMRALSLTDVAAWDLAAKAAGQTITRYLGGEPQRMPVTAIVGYPPTIDASAVSAQVESLWAQGWRRFKLPMAPTHDATIDRIQAAREAAPKGWIGLDANMVFRTATAAIAFARQIESLNIGWLEDVVPPGDAGLVADIRAAIGIPIAVGDEQGGSYYPQALLAFDAVDVCRVDATTNGGVTRFRAILDMIAAAGKAYSPHMFPHLHSRILSGLGYVESAIEWGIPGTDVHPMDDSLTQPTVSAGLMDPLPDELGFGNLVDPAWVRAQTVRDPDGLLEDL